MMPKNKTIQVKSVVIHIEATSMTADTLIPAYRSCSPSHAASSLPGMRVLALNREGRHCVYARSSDALSPLLACLAGAGEGQLVDESATSSSLEPCRQIDHAGVDGDQEQAERGTQQEVTIMMPSIVHACHGRCQHVKKTERPNNQGIEARRVIQAGPSTSAIQTAVSIAERELPAPDGSQLHIQNDDPNASQHKTYYINALFMQSPWDVEQS